MKRKYRLKRLKKFRAIMSEAMGCDNSGRLGTLIMSLPNVTHYSFSGGWTSWADITLTGGFEYSSFRRTEHCFKHCHLQWIFKKAYIELIKSISNS